MAAIEYERYTYYNYNNSMRFRNRNILISIGKLFKNSPISIQCKEIENVAKFHFVCV